MDYGPRECAICGKKFIPRSKIQKTCGDPYCVVKWKNRRKDGRRRVYKPKPKPEDIWQPKPDTIVAIGYAERQMAETLKMAGKVNTKL